MSTHSTQILREKSETLSRIIFDVVRPSDIRDLTSVLRNSYIVLNAF